MLNLKCKIGLHKWGKKKQWLDKDGNPVFTERCSICNALKKKREV